MPTTTFSATAMRYYQGGWTNGQARQGFVNGAATRGEITFNFADTVDVSNIDISSIVLRFTVGSLGGAYTKYLYLHTGSYNGTSVGSYSFSGCYNTSKSKTFSPNSNSAGFNVLKAYIEGGGTKLGVYTGTSRGSGSGKSYDYDYMNITAMSLELTYTYKKSTGSISSASTGSAATLNIAAYNSTYSHKVTWKLGSWSATQTIAAGVTTASYTIPHSALPNATSGTATVTLETLNGSTSLGSSTYSFAVSVPASVVPSIGGLTLTPVNSGASTTAFGWGLYIQNRTKCTATMTSVAAGSGATVKSYSLTTSPGYGSSTSSSLTTGLLTAGGTVTFTAKVTDSRGRTATKTATITVQAYNAPVFTATPSAYRCNSAGTRDDTGGTYARLTASFFFSSIKSGTTEKNSLTVKKVVLNNVTTNLTSGTAVTLGAGALAVDSSYNAVITLTDAVGSTTTYTVTIPSAAYIIHIAKGGKAVGIGQAASGTNKLNVKWATDFGSWIRSTGGDFYRQRNDVDISQANNGLSANAYPRYRVADKNEKDLARIGAWVQTDGKVGVGMSVLNYVNGTHTEKTGLICYLDKNGNQSYSFGSAAAFRNNLGLGNTTGALPAANGGTGQTSLQAARNAMGLGNTTGALPVANGGTGVTGKTSQTLTLTSSFVAYTYDETDTGYHGVIMYRNGLMVELHGTVSPKAQIAAGGTATICTVPSGYRPAYQIVQICQGSGNRTWTLRIKTDGSAIFERYNLGGTSAAAGTNVWLPFHVVWML